MSSAVRTRTDWGKSLASFLDRSGKQEGWTTAWADDGSWLNFGLGNDGHELDGASDLCPVTCALLRRVPGVTVAGFSKVLAGGRIQPHTDGAAGLSAGRKAMHLCLEGKSWLRVGRTWYLQRPGRIIVFDPEVQHEVVNPSAHDRTLLYINFRVSPTPALA